MKDRFKSGEIVRLDYAGRYSNALGWGRITGEVKLNTRSVQIWFCYSSHHDGRVIAFHPGRIKKLRTKAEKFEALTLRILGKL